MGYRKNILNTKAGWLVMSLATMLTLALAPAGVMADTSGSGGSDSRTSTSTTTTTTTQPTSTSTDSHSGDSVSSGSGSKPSSDTTQRSDGSPSASESSKPESRQAVENTPVVNNETELEIEAKDLLASARQGKQLHTEQQRQTACQAHQKAVDTQIAALGAQTQQNLNTFNSIFTMVQAYQTKNQLNVPSYASLVATAQAKQATAATAVSLLKSVSVTVDCSVPDPAQSIAAVQVAVRNARTALQAYIAAIKDIVVALQGTSSTSAH